MVVGNGLIARAFQGFKNVDQVLIFASGVSNSLEKDPAAYARELSLLKDYSNFEGKFVYFSTLSIFDPALSKSPYVLHKRKMEEVVSSYNNYLVLRLPNLVGRGGNPNTLLNFLHNAILEEREIPVYTNTVRYILDVDDVVSWVEKLLTKGTINVSLNLCGTKGFSVMEILEVLEHASGKKARVKPLDVGEPYFPVCEPVPVSLDCPSPRNYLEKLIFKYFS